MFEIYNKDKDKPYSSCAYGFFFVWQISHFDKNDMVFLLITVSSRYNILDLLHQRRTIYEEDARCMHI